MPKIPLETFDNEEAEKHLTTNIETLGIKPTDTISDITYINTEAPRTSATSEFKDSRNTLDPNGSIVTTRFNSSTTTVPSTSSSSMPSLITTISNSSITSVPTSSSPEILSTSITETSHFIVPMDAEYFSNFVGIVNESRYCFAISVFQLLYHCKTFRKALRHYRRINKDENGNNTGNPELFGLYRIFEALVHADNGKYIHLEKKQIRAALPSKLRTGKNEDAGEVLHHYMAVEDFDWDPFNIYETSRTTTTRKDDSTPLVSDSFIRNTALILDFPVYNKAKNVNLLDLLAHHHSPKRIEHVEEWGENSKTKHLQLTGESFPKTLLIQLMRFYVMKGKEHKNNSKVTISEVIDLNNYAIKKTESGNIYHLNGFIKHTSEELNSGSAHYYAIVRGPNDTWIKLDDSKVSKISRERMLKEAEDGYIFLYHNYE